MTFRRYYSSSECSEPLPSNRRTRSEGGLPLSICWTASFPIWAAVKPCSDTSEASAPYPSNSLQVWRWPASAARCNAVWPNVSRAFTCKSKRLLLDYTTQILRCFSQLTSFNMLQLKPSTCLIGSWMLGRKQLRRHLKSVYFHNFSSLNKTIQ